jgi:hypothetical protein
MPRQTVLRNPRAAAVIWLGTLALAAFLSTTCGRKAPPVPPRQAPPPAVTDLGFQLQGHRLVLTWSLPSVESNVAPQPEGFILYRARSEVSAVACSNCPKIFTPITRVAFGVTDAADAWRMRWRCETPLENGFHYTFKLRTVLAGGRQGPDSNLVELDH